jgi:Mg2+ and Co2+ transporter CorA
MPELQMRYAYPAVLLVMAAIAATMALFFKRRGWW